jgi:hypothetical protein
VAELKFGKMIKLQKFGKLSVLLMVFAGLASCNKNDNTAPFEVIGEAAIIKKLVEEELVYARVYYAYGNQPMASATVTLPEGGVYTLSAADSYKRTYYKEPEAADFSTSVPETGIFTFKVVNEDIEHTVNEELVARGLGIPNITEATPSAANQSITVKWNLVADAENYLVRLLDDQDEQVFSGTLLKNSVVSFIIAPGSGTWNKTLENGKTYTVQVEAFIYEDSATSNDYMYNIDEIAIGSKSIVWTN